MQISKFGLTRAARIAARRADADRDALATTKNILSPDMTEHKNIIKLLMFTKHKKISFMNRRVSTLSNRFML